MRGGGNDRACPLQMPYPGSDKEEFVWGTSELEPSDIGTGEMSEAPLTQVQGTNYWLAQSIVFFFVFLFFFVFQRMKHIDAHHCWGILRYYGDFGLPREESCSSPLEWKKKLQHLIVKVIILFTQSFSQTLLTLLSRSYIAYYILPQKPQQSEKSIAKQYSLCVGEWAGSIF